MNKEKLTAELVCLLETASRPQDVAKFKSLIEEYFITGSARIDLIGKIMDLDNEMGGYIFDIPLLEKTQKAIADVNKSPGRKPYVCAVSLSLVGMFFSSLHLFNSFL